ncbi:hypothetical protein H5395_17040 [Paracoccus sp. MC1854]|uniref:hypothetical protein n=1 Tax=Paracoccus sp. MC1854 TaxID=2760306 RepID=UPI001600320D|nr:hypothetical protein [Paracoccus sp. MC1854]MBB1493171.1 hypothetical protein [Paracoccus sp. MC1854]
MHEQILEHCKRLESLRPDLPRLEVYARVNLLPTQPLSIQIEYRPSHDATWDQAIRHSAPSFDAAEAWLLAQDDPEQIARNQFTRDLAHLLERARDLDMPIVADLAATMARLNTNILPSLTERAA